MSYEVSKIEKNKYFNAYLVGLYCVCLFAALYFVTYAIYNFDIFWHIANGRAMLDQGRIVNEEIFSFTASGREFRNHAWLAQIIFYLFFDNFGATGLLLFKLGIVVVIFTILIHIAYSRGADIYVSCLVVTTACIAGAHRFMVRPELFSLFGIALVLLFLLYSDKCSLSKKSAIVVPLGFLLWNCLHGAVYGFFIVGIYVGSISIVFYFRRQLTAFPEEFVKDKRDILFVWFLFFIAFALVIVAPFGMNYYDLYVGFTDNSEVVAVTSEFLPTSLHEVFVPFWVFFVCSSVVLLFAFLQKRLTLSDCLLFIMMAFLAIRFNRATTPFLLVASPMVAVHASYLYRNKVKKKLGIFLSIVVFCCLLAVIAFSLKVKAGYPPMKFDWGVNETPSSVYPIGISRFLNDHPISGNLYNSDRFGGYLAYYLPAETKIFFYNLPSVFGDMFKYVHNKDWIEKWKINYAIVGHSIETQYLFTPQEWVPIYWEHNALLLVRKNVLNKGIIGQYRLQYFTPQMSQEHFNGLIRQPHVEPVLLQEVATYLSYRKDDRIANMFADSIFTAGAFSKFERSSMVQATLRYNAENDNLQKVLRDLTDT